MVFGKSFLCYEALLFLATGKKEEVLARVKRRIGSPNEAHAESILVRAEVELVVIKA